MRKGFKTMNYQRVKEAYENGEATNMSDFEFDKLEAAETGKSDVVDFGKLPRTRGCKTYDVEKAVDYIMTKGSAILMPKYDGIYAKLTFGRDGEVVQVLTKEGNDITEWFNDCAYFKYIPDSSITVELLPADWKLTRADLVKALNAKSRIDLVVYHHSKGICMRVVYASEGRESVRNALLHFDSLEARTDGIAIYAEKKPFYFKF